jgi:DNA invertase Pin-like site-specific DNA recombinase
LDSGREIVNGNFVSYLRVSTTAQGQSGLGLEAQRESVARYLNGGDWVLLGEYVEVESGGNRERPELAKAIALARKHKATLIVAKLDRLARDTTFVLGLADTGVKLRFVDMPGLRLDGTAADRFVVTLMASFAELEKNVISERTKAALAAKKARGEKLGNLATLRGLNTDRAAGARAQAATLKGTLGALQAQGYTQREMAAELQKLGVRTANGGTTWRLSQVQRVLARLS